MASSDARYTIRMTMEISQEGEDTPMQTSSLTWNGLNYLGAVALEGIMVEAVQKTVDLGVAAAEALGNGAPAKAAK